MPSPRVSVVCIFLNVERFLAEAIESVLVQDFPDFELLLVDDGSTDASTGIARGLAGRFPAKLRYLEHPGHSNRGMSASRNLGIRSASAPYVAFIDADDRWRGTKLSEQVAILDREREAAMACGRVNYWSSWRGGTDRLVYTGHARDGLSRAPETLLRLYPLGVADAPCPSDVMVRRAAIDAVGGFDEHFTGFYEDMAFFAKIFAEWPVCFSSRAWTDYRQHDDSASSLTRPDQRRSIRRTFLDRFESYVDGRRLPEKAKIRRAIALARWELEHPWLGRCLRAARVRLSRLQLR